MWLRVIGALVVTLLALGFLDYLGANSLLGGRGDDLQDIAQGRAREMFWFGVFVLVMATAVLAAARRWIAQLKPAPAVRPDRTKAIP